MAISVVHVTKANATSVTIPSTTAGNCLLVLIASRNGSAAATVSGVTLGGSAGNFASLTAAHGNNGFTTWVDVFAWADPNCAGGQTSVVISGTGLNCASGTGGVTILEISGIVASSPLDKSHTGTGTNATFSSGATATTSQAVELWAGIGETIGTAAGPGGAWTDESPAGGVVAAGYQVTSSTGAATYSGTNSSGNWAALVVALLGTTASNVALPVAQVTITAPAPSPTISLALPVAQVTITAPVPGVGSGKFVALPVAQVTITAYPPGVPFYLPAAQVTVTAWPPAPTVPPAGVVNQWAATFSRPAAFGPSPPALQSTVVPLTPATSVGGGSGTSTPGNWLFCMVAVTEQSASSGFTVAAADDIHSFWRPGDETTSTWAVSTATALTRTSIWYTPNTARQVNTVYVAPSGPCAAFAVLVIEVSGLGAWDTVTGIYSNYAAAATSLNLTLPAPSASAFLLAAVSGDSTAAGQSFAPGGWSALAAVNASNGADHTCDAVLTSACITTTGSVSVNGTTSSASDLSGVVIGVLASAPSPIPAAHNPNWPLVKFEAAFGGGFQTPPDQLTWHDLSNRLWSWDETTGAQYQLGEIQATNLDLELDNFDNALASDYPGSPYYSNALNSNMSFQSGYSPWAAAGAGTVIAQSSAHSYASSPGAVAAFSLQVTPDGAHAAPGAISEKTTVLGSTAYSASAWFYSVAGYGTGAQVAITWYTSGGSVISTVTSGTLAIPAATWTQVTELNQTSPSNAAFAAVTVQFSGTPSATAYWVAEAALNLGSSAVAAGLVTTGVPLRIRAAAGTLGGVTSNRWYVIQRNAEEWPQQIDAAYRRYVTVTATDIWSAMSNSGPTPYRGEVLQDNPYAWWAMDDQPLEGGIQPTSLRNSAPGNTNVLSIIASPNGTGPTSIYGTDGYSFSSLGPAQGGTSGLATYAVAQAAGWLYGDPQASQTTYDTGNPVTASPGSAALQVGGQFGNTGSYGWFASCNDASFPALAGGITAEGWFQYPFFGSTNTVNVSGLHITAQQPYCPLTLLTLTTGSLPVAILQLDLAGHLSLITYNGGTGTAHGIYSATDLRDSAWHHYAVTLTATTWTVYVDGGVTARTSGTATGMTSAWSWLVVNGDMGASGGGAAGNIQHSGNCSVSHITVYPSVLPGWRILAHYCAGTTGFGLIPAPQTVTATVTDASSSASPPPTTPDGLFLQGAYGAGQVAFTMSVRVAAEIGSYTSGPSAWVTTGGFPSRNLGGIGETVYVSFTGVAPAFGIYNASQVGSETQAAVTASNGDDFKSGYGSGAAGYGIGQVSGGSGAAFPAAPSPLGDTVAQRIERCLYYGKVTYPGRCIDPAALQVQAATDIGGQQTGTNVQSIVGSDGGLYYVDNLGNSVYWQKSHLASQYSSPVWAIGPSDSPYYREIRWIPDPHRIWNAVVITPVSPDGANLPLIVPTQSAQVAASQQQFGAQPKQVSSYLQSQAEMQTQANWTFAEYGSLHVRAENVMLDAAPAPALFPLVLGINVGDLITLQNWQIGGGGVTWTLRVSEIKRLITFGGGDAEDLPKAQVTLKCDFEPNTYWS